MNEFVKFANFLVKQLVEDNSIESADLALTQRFQIPAVDIFRLCNDIIAQYLSTIYIWMITLQLSKMELRWSEIPHEWTFEITVLLDVCSFGFQTVKQQDL